MKELQSALGVDIPITTRGILYLCELKDHKLTVFRELFFTSGWEALNAYANIPNPESQLVTGKTFDGLIANLLILHKSINNPAWIEELENQI